MCVCVFCYFPIRFLIHTRTKGEADNVKHVQTLPYLFLTYRSKAVLLLFLFFFVICGSRLSLSYCLVCSLQLCDHLLGKGWPVGSLVCDVFFMLLSLSQMVFLVRCGT